MKERKVLVFDVRTVFSKDRVNDVAELTGNRAKTGAVVFALGTFALVESVEIGVEVNGNVGSDKQSSAQIG